MPWEALVRKRGGGGALGSLVVEGIWCGQHFFWAGNGMGTPRLQSQARGSYKALELLHGLSRFPLDLICS